MMDLFGFGFFYTYKLVVTIIRCETMSPIDDYSLQE
jgi:hypothetical protein